MTMLATIDKSVSAEGAVDNTVFDTKEAAEYLHVCYDTIIKKSKSKELPHFRIGAKILFRKWCLDEWIAQQETTSER